jgi:RecA/RadA recombinase
MNEYIDRARVLLTSAVTWLIAAQLVIQYALTQDVVAGIPLAAQVGGQVLAFIANAILIIRRVTPVAPEERGILSQ